MGLFGGLLGFLGGRKNRKSQERMHAQDTYNNSPQGIRANAEEAGFNPLTVLTSGRSFGAGYAPVFGNEYAALGQGLDDFFAGREAEKIQRSELAQENQRLKELVQKTTLGPPVPGIYGASPPPSALPKQEVRRTEETFVTDGGSAVDIPLGPDLDEFLLGKVVDSYGNYRRVKERTRFNQRGLGSWRNQTYVGPASRPRVFGYDPKPQYPPYLPSLNPPLRGYYGPPGSRTGF